jgi:hypothetical protein
MAEEKKAGKEKTPAKPDAPARADSGPESAEKRKKKINEMTLKEIEDKLAEVKAAQGGLSSRYARQLLARKKSLAF